MKFLRERGIAEAGDHLLHKTGTEHIAAAAFFAKATDLLHEVGPYVSADIVRALPTHEGTWHPTGFMVFPLGVHAVLGTLRLHVWPAGHRQRVIQGRGNLGEIFDGDIHNHSWNITSLVLTAYHDNIYAVSPAEEDRDAVAEAELYRKFSVSYLPGSYQSLVTDGRHVLARPAERRVVPGGQIHTILADVYHAPVVPMDTAGATLVFSSPRVHGTGPDVLIGGTGGAVQGTRREVTRAEAEAAREQLRSMGVE